MRASDPLTPAVAQRYVAFQSQLDLQQAGLQPVAPLRMPGVGPWERGSGRCASCENRTERRRCPDCDAALRAILASERRRLADKFLPWRWGAK